MPSDGEEPGFELRLAIVLVAALENADPRLLKKILGALFVSSDVHEIAEQAELTLFNQAVAQIGAARLQAARGALCFLSHESAEEGGCPWRGPTRELYADSDCQLQRWELGQIGS